MVLAADPQPGELVVKNNRLDAYLTVLEGGLRILYLDRTKVSDAGLEHLKGLRLAGLYLDGTTVTDAGLEHLTRMTNLKFLSLSWTAPL